MRAFNQLKMVKVVIPFKFYVTFVVAWNNCCIFDGPRSKILAMMKPKLHLSGWRARFISNERIVSWAVFSSYRDEDCCEIEAYFIRFSTY